MTEPKQIPPSHPIDNFQWKSRQAANRNAPGPPIRSPQIGTAQTRSSSKISTVNISFLLIAVICLLNLNGVLALTYKADRLASGAILFLGLYIASRTPTLLQTALSPAGKAFVGFLGFYLAMGTMVKPDRVQLISHINSIFLVVVAALATVYNAKRNTLPRFMILTSLIATAGAFTVYLSPLLGDLYSQIRSVERVNSTGRWMGFFANPNDTGFAAVLALALTLPVSAIAVKPNPIRRCKTFISIVLGIGVLLTFSRSAILAFLLCILINWLVTAKLNTKGVYAAVATTGLLLIIYWFFTIGYQAFEWTTEQEGRIESISRILTFQRASDSDLGHRMEGVTAGLAYFRESPIIGNGLGSMHRMPDKYFRGLGCHNTHLMVLGEVGILGFSLYLFALASYLRNTMQMREEAPRLFCLLLLVTFLLDGMVSHKVLDTRSYNLLLGVAFGLQVIFGSGRRP